MVVRVKKKCSICSLRFHLGPYDHAWKFCECPILLNQSKVWKAAPWFHQFYLHDLYKVCFCLPADEPPRFMLSCSGGHISFDPTLAYRAEVKLIVEIYASQPIPFFIRKILMRMMMIN